jgi:hypothetical protein
LPRWICFLLLIYSFCMGSICNMERSWS